MSEMTLERLVEKWRAEANDDDNVKAGYLPASDLYSWKCAEELQAYIDAHLTRAPVQVTDEVARDVAECLQFSGWATGGDFEDDFLPDVRRALEYARMAQPVVAKVPSLNAMMDSIDEYARTFLAGNGDGVRVRSQYDRLYKMCEALLSKPHPQAAQGGEANGEAAVEISPEFTDSAHGAIAWVLYHHQGGSSPIGQPLRFALGLDAHEHLPKHLIDQAKHYASWAGATTERFHAESAPVPDQRDAEIARLNAIINTPQADDFLRATSTEAEHQRQRWGTSHDAGKEPSDWFWMIGYLAGKALHAHAAGNIEKAEHHIITTAAACANWHRAMFGQTDMRPGIDGESALSAAPTLAGKEKG